jgi:hypothetical protein
MTFLRASKDAHRKSEAFCTWHPHFGPNFERRGRKQHAVTA